MTELINADGSATYSADVPAPVEVLGAGSKTKPTRSAPSA